MANTYHPQAQPTLLTLNFQSLNQQTGHDLTISKFCTNSTPRCKLNTPLDSPLSPLSAHQNSEQMTTILLLRPFPQTARRRRRRRRQYSTVGYSGSTPRPSPCSSLALRIRLSSAPSPPVPSRDLAIKDRTAPTTPSYPPCPRRAPRPPRATPRCPGRRHEHTAHTRAPRERD